MCVGQLGGGLEWPGFHSGKGRKLPCSSMQGVQENLVMMCSLHSSTDLLRGETKAQQSG